MKPTLDERYEQGIDHDPRSIAIYRHVKKLDDEECEGSLRLTSGGDGDNGEHIMYLMDDYFWELDAAGKALPVKS